MNFTTIEQMPKSHQTQAALHMLMDLSESSKEMLRLKELIFNDEINGLTIFRLTSKYNGVAYIKDIINNHTVAVRYMGKFLYRITIRENNSNNGRSGKVVAQKFINKEKITFSKTIKQEIPDVVIYRDSNTVPSVSELLLLILYTN